MIPKRLSARERNLVPLAHGLLSERHKRPEMTLSRSATEQNAHRVILLRAA